MFDSMKKQAASAAAAGYASGSAAASGAYSAAKERVDTGLAGKKMVDEGGEPMVQKLLAKSAAVDATNFDRKVVSQLPRAVGSYTFAVEKLRAGAEHAAGETPSFNTLASDYEARVSVLTSAMTKSNGEPECVSVSPAENDAITIVTTKAAASGLGASLRKSVSSVGEGSKPAEDASSSAPGEAGSASGAGAWLQGAVDAAKDRVQVAKDAKKMVDEGGDALVAKLLGKKASVDATNFEQALVEQLRQAIAKYADAASKLESSGPQAGESPAFEKLASDYVARAALLQQVLDSMVTVPAPASVSPQERDAIVYMVANIKVNDTKTAVTGSIQEVQEKAVEAAMGQALSGATGGAVTKAPDGSGKVAMKVAADNPELAKAAVSAAAKQAAK